ncbi:MAG: putative rane protein [Frankiales bacterium]|jgi:hypothetical protein|nr:putative rane protein [Frankiales bacterium]
MLSPLSDTRAARRGVTRRPFTSAHARPERRAWLCTLLLFATASTLWSLATPLFDGPDEYSHLIRGYTVTGGEFVPTVRSVDPLPAFPDVIPGADDLRDVVLAPSPLVRPEFFYPTCLIARYDNTPRCLPALATDVGETQTITNASRYPPLYYSLVGAPLRLLPGTGQGVLLSRLLSSLLGALFLASAVASAYQSRHRTLLLGGLAAAVTPQVLYTNGVVNPSALEISAAISFWMAGIVLVTGDGAGVDRRLLLRLAAAAVGLTAAKATGPLLLLLIATVLLVVAGHRRLLPLLRQPLVIGAAVVVAVTGVLSVLWNLLVGPNPLPLTPTLGADVTTNTIIRMSIGLWDGWTRQMIGNFGWNDLPAPQLTHYVWLLVLGALLVGAAVVARGRLALALGLLVTMVLVLPVVASTLLAPAIGFGYQGRYTLPVAVGVPLLSALALGTPLSELAVTRRALLVVVSLCATAHAGAFVYALHRYTVGQSGPLRFWTQPEWEPAVPSAWLVLAVLAVAAAAVGLAAASRPSPPARAETTPVALDITSPAGGAGSRRVGG